MAASTPLFASFDVSDARRVNFSDVAPRTLSPPPPATASAPNLDLQQLEEAWTPRMEPGRAAGAGAPHQADRDHAGANYEVVTKNCSRKVRRLMTFTASTSNMK